MKPEHGLEWKCWKFRAQLLSKTDVDSILVYGQCPVYCIYYYFYSQFSFCTSITTEWEMVKKATTKEEGQERCHCVRCGDTQMRATEKLSFLEALLGK